MPTSTYTVKGGDTVSAIAKANGVKVSDVSGYRSGNANLIYPGETLTINGAAAAPAAPAPTAPTQATTTTTDLNTFQATTLNSIDPVSIRDSAIVAADKLAPVTDAPAPLNTAALRSQLNEANGVQELSDQLNALKSQQDDLDAEQRSLKVNEKGKTVALDVITGRVGQEAQTYQDKQDFLTRQVNSVTNQLNTRLQVVQTAISDNQTDYQAAVSAYNTSVSNHFNMLQFIYGVGKDQMTYQEQQKQDAVANLQFMQQTFATSGTTWSQLPDTQKALVNQLEVQAGFPVGFLQNAMPTTGKLISTTTRDDGKGHQYVDMVSADATGKVTVTSKLVGNVPLPAAKSVSAADTQAAVTKGAIDFTNSKINTQAVYTTAQAGHPAGSPVIGSDGYIDAPAYKQLLNSWTSQGLSASSFNDQYGQYINPKYATSYVTDAEFKRLYPGQYADAHKTSSTSTLSSGN